MTGYGFTLTNTGSISGGAGGANGVYGYGGPPLGKPVPSGLGSGGYGGVGVTATGGSTVIDSGAISGGLGADGVTRADAIDFSNGGNTLVLEAGALITGNVVSTSGTSSGGDTLTWGGDVNGSGGNVFDLGQLDAVGGTGQYQGFANLGKSGASTWTLTGTDSQNQAWTIAAGTLILDGSVGASGGATISGGTFQVGDANTPSALFTGDVAVDAGGTLSGHGTVAGNVSNAGTVMPGGTPGILTVSGNYTQTAAGTLMMQIGAPTAGSGYSQLQVGGSASLAGDLLLGLNTGYQVGSTYDLVHAAGGVSSTFAQDLFSNAALAAYLTPTVTYTANDVFLTLKANPAAFSKGYPSYPSTMSAALGSSFQTVLGGFGSVPGMGGITTDARSGAWAQYTGSGGDLGGTHQNLQVGAAGGGAAINDQLVIGAAVAGGSTTTTLSPSRVVADPVGVFAYGIYRSGGLRVAASIGGGSLRQTTTRELPTLGLTGQAVSTGHFDGAAARAEYRLSWGGSLFLSPYAEASYLHSQYGSAQETGAGALDLGYGALSQNLTRYGAGLRLGTVVPEAHSTLTPWVQVGAVGYSGDLNPVQMQSLGGQTFAVSGAALPGSAVTTAAGLDWKGHGPWRFKLAWFGEFGASYHDNGGTAILQYVW